MQLAGSVTARKTQRAATSDWMELERKRGISVSSTVLQFEYNNYWINLLDTPGHKDFSEDTYRVLTAVDSVVMVIDAGKGIEAQTRKLFEICRRRQIPIFTFMNKMDRPSRDPLELLDELERVLGLRPFAMNWPLGSGIDFKGVYDRVRKQVHFFERTAGGAYKAPVSVHGLNDDAVKETLDPEVYRRILDENEMLEHAGSSFDAEALKTGHLTPVFFGSAVNNFGVQLLLDGFLENASEPRSRFVDGAEIRPESDAFSGFIFKIQANMDPRHRDRLAFVRVCSGKFERDMTVVHTRTGKKVRLSSSHKLFGRDRETLDVAYAGDIVGLVGHGEFGLGDTLSVDEKLTYREIPRFTPECFAWLQSTNTGQFKRFREGMDQLLQERVVQAIYIPDSAQRVPLLAAVGPLQFEVVQYRMQTEYGADCRLESSPWQVMRWVAPEVTAEQLEAAIIPTGARLAKDAMGQNVILFADQWSSQYFADRNSAIPISELPYDQNFAPA